MYSEVLLIFFTKLAFSHVLNYDSVTVCDGMAKQIQCPGKENIHVLQGFYGKWRNRNCKGDAPDPLNYPTCRIPRGRATAIVKQLCQGQNTCKLISDKSIYGNPCPRTIPYLYVTFFCMAPGQKLFHQKTLFNEEVVTVPSHGFVVSETRHHLDEDIAAEEQRSQGTFRESIPAENSFEKLMPKVEPQKFASIARKIMQKPEPSINRESMQKPEIISDTDAWDRSKITVSENNENLLPNEVGEVHSVFHVAPNSIKNNQESDEEKDNQNFLTKSQIKNVEINNKKQEPLINEAAPHYHSEKSSTDVTIESHHQSENALDDVAHFQRSVFSLPKLRNLESNKQKSFISQNDPSLLKNHSNFKTDSVKSFRDAMICNGQSKLIACLPEEVIKVHHAFYGKRSGESCLGPLEYKDEAPTCSALDARTNVQSSCDGKQTCLLFADDNIYGKSLCPNVNKYLHLRYTCNEGAKGFLSKSLKLVPQVETEENAVVRSIKSYDNHNQTMSLCNGERRAIKCETNDGIKINSVFYGKKVGKDCKGDLNYRDDIPECSSTRALDIIKLTCEKKKKCEVESNSAMFEDDLCPGVNKYLEVKYRC
ncbi:uncharacterized protein LOC100215668 [Hydra vulgaris]|uniref:uncharacterized protein LOC100215668 n=1 Tax=Hydra vulgaris TaxID=6087 RepID=UPI001F5E7A89|nr:uncharacterized protein LOC100215668 [Hydra vulgaris]